MKNKQQAQEKIQSDEAIIYARVSSKEQDETGYSLPSQINLLKDYAARKGLKVVRVFEVPESASGAKERKAFNEMMELLLTKGIGNLLCEKVDRLTRNLKDAVTVNDWIEENDNRQVHFVKQNLVIHHNARSDERFRWDIEIVLAKKYIANLSEEVKKGQVEKLREGWLPTKPPPGYKTIGEKGHKIHVRDEQQMPIVIKLFELYATGNYSLKKLEAMAYEMGFRNHGGRRIYKSRLAQILTDPFYIGKVRYKGQIHPGAQEPLISEELFDKVQMVLRSNTTPRYRKHFPLFKALIECEECGGSVTWETQKGHWYGHCNHYRNCTRKKFVRQELVEEQLLTYFEQIAVKSPALIAWIKKALKEMHQNEVGFNTASREEINKRYENAQRRIEALYDDKLDGKISEEFYARKFAQYKQEKDEALTALKRHNSATNNYYELACNVLDLSSRAKEIYLNPKRTDEERRMLVTLLFSRIGLHVAGINPNFTPGFGVLTGYAKMWNKKFEPTENSITTKRLAPSDAEFSKLLRHLDSNQEPTP